MKKIGVIGTGSWGTTISLLISTNIQNNNKYSQEVLLWGIQEKHGDQYLSDVINNKHINEKYLPGIFLGKRIRCTSDISDFSNIDILVVALPHQFINTIQKFKECINENTVILSVVKGFLEKEDHFVLISEYIKDILGLSTNVLMGANIATDVAQGITGNILYKCEGTLGYEKDSDRDLLYDILNNEMYKIGRVKDVIGVEICGSLKNVIALGYGLMSGLKCSENTKVAFLRNGLIEIKEFLNVFYPQTQINTLFESCGVADLIVSCQSGRNYKFGKEKAIRDISLDEFEKEMGGQKIQGVGTALCLYKFIKMKNKEKEFVIFTLIYRIFCEQNDVKIILQAF